MLGSNLSSQSQRFLLALYQVRQQKHSEPTEEEKEMGIIQNEQTISTYEAKDFLEIADDKKFKQKAIDVLPRLINRGHLKSVSEPSTEGYIGQVKFSDRGIRTAKQLLKSQES